MAELLDPSDRLRAQKVLAALRSELAKREEKETHPRRVADDAQAVRDECLSFSGFVRNAWHIPEPGVRYMPNWHVDAIAAHLEAIHKKEITRLVINMPPGLMKSTTVGVMFPAWEWGPMGAPWLRYFTTSYEAGWARRDSRKHRDLVLSEWYQSLWPNVTLTKTAEDNFENSMKGARKAVPFSRLTSGRGNRLIIDDPHSTEGVESDAEREKATRMFRESASSRLNNQETDAIVVVMQRLHPQDLCGVINDLGLPYVKLILPMEYQRSLSVKTPFFEDPRTEEGELLHPRFMGREKVEEKKVEVGEHAWPTQYQQQARARDGAYYFSDKHILVTQQDKSLAPVMNIPRLDTVFAIADTASKVGAKRDGSGVMYCGFAIHPTPQAYILDWDIQQLQADVLISWLPGVLARCEELAVRFKARGGSQGAFVEDKDSGVALIQAAQKNRWRVRAIPSEFTALGKEGRAVSVSGYVYKGGVKFWHEAYNKVAVYKGRSKNHAYDQITTFRMGKGTTNDEDELFDCFCGVAGLCFGNWKAT